MTKTDFRQDMTDAELCRAATEGSLEAEEQLILRYRRSVLVSSRSYFLLGGDNEDLVQEGMVGLLKAIRSYREDRAASFGTYAEHCVCNALVSAVRAAARNKHTPLNTSIPLENPQFDDTTDYLNVEASGPGQDPERLIIHQEEMRDFLHAIHSQLSGFEEKILGLYLQGLSYSEIAARVNRPVKSVDNAVQRVRRKLSHYFSSGDYSFG